MKLFGVFLLVTLYVAVQSQSHNYQWGNATWNDALLYRDIIKKSSSFLQVVTKDVKYPNGTAIVNRTITAIRANDQYINGKGGYVSILAGGVGFNSTTLHFKSQRGNGFDFILEIYGR